MSDAHQSHDMHGGRHNRAGHRDDRTAGETDLRAQDRHGGHGAHGGNHGDHVALFRRLFWINLALAVPAVLLSGMFADLLGYSLPDVPGLAWVAPVLGTAIYLWGGRPFLTGAVAASWVSPPRSTIPANLH